MINGAKILVKIKINNFKTKKPTIVFIGTYPPRECGIATFTQDLLTYSRKYLGREVLCKVAAFNVSALDKHVYPPEVEWEIDQNNKKQHIDLAKNVNSNPAITGVILEHEYGIYGGKYGENILYFIDRCKKPILVTLHTVLPAPPKNMKEITEKIVNRANAIVVLTANSKKVLEEVYPTAVGKVMVIPHGIHPVKFVLTTTARKNLKLGNRQILTTFGLLSRGKGIEYVIKALPAVVKKNPKILYLILGKTHPVVHRKEGEVYRRSLTKLVAKLHLTKHVKFYDQYLNLKDLFRFLKATDIYISTSINTDQAVSGTLSYALGAGRAAVSTEFAQAKEIITDETGRLVPIKNPKAMSVALNDLLSDKTKLKHMHQSAYEMTRPMLWSNVAKLYTKLLIQKFIPPINLEHLYKLTDETGMWQFTKIKLINKKFGYTIDDNARAMIVSNQLPVKNLVNTYLEFIKKCQKKNGSFINYIGYKNKKSTGQNRRENLEEANARTMWALSEVMSNKLMLKSIRKTAFKIFWKAWPKMQNFEYLRPKAFLIKAAVILQKETELKHDELKETIKKYADDLMLGYKIASKKTEWTWFENGLYYNNGILPEAMFLAGAALKNKEYLKTAIKSFDFLIENTFKDSYYLPVGSNGWYKKGENRAEFDQQPEDPSSMILALVTAYETTGNEMYRNLAPICFSWFLGNNTLDLSVYDYADGGCYDGITENGVNLNQGAESLLSFLLSRLAVAKLNINEN